LLPGMFDPRLPKSWRARVLAFVLVAIVGVLGAWLWLATGGAGNPDDASATPTPKSGASAASRHWRPATGDAGTDALPPAHDGDAVRGKVVDAVSGAPIGGADVTLRATDGSVVDEAATGADGVFSFPHARGETIAAEAKGYAMAATEIPAGSGASRVVLALDGAATVRGKIVDAAGRAVDGADVWVEDVEGLGDRWPAPTSGTVHSGADGTFAIRDAPAGRLVVHATHPAHASGSVAVGVLGPGRTKDGILLTLADGATITGRVTNPDGTPAAGALVALYVSWREEDGPGGPGPRVEAGADGTYRVEHVLPGSGFVAAATSDAEAAAPITIADAHEIHADLSLVAGAEISGRVEDESGAPIAGATLRVRAVGLSAERDAIASRVRGELRRREGTASDSDGRFHLRGLMKPGPYEVEATAPTGEHAQASAQPGDAGVRLVVVRGGAVAGEIVARDGTPANVEGMVWIEGPGGRDASGFSAGSFREEGFSAGEYDVDVSVNGFGRLPSQRVTVAPGAVAQVRFTLPATAIVRGRLVGADGTPVRGARVSIAQRRGRAIAGEMDNGLDWSSAQRSGPDGRFELPASAGEHSLFVYHPEFQPAVVPVNVAEAGDTDVGTIEMHGGVGASAVFEFSGIGAVLAIDDGRYVVRDVLAKSPAENAGLKKNDQVLAVDGVPTQGQSMEDVILRIRGPVGTTVSLDILRPGNVDSFRLDIVRQQIKA
ncbi:MAG TPA: carboxypeptidase regulatory-like domain-containing protein, partial [bacterium]|nr:carboxypeptidase regulatory-like domain-containing protein [bacterium]